MANSIENYLIKFGEELGKEGYSIIKAGVNTLLRAKGELVEQVYDTYINTRLAIRIECFAYEQERLSREQRKKFYQNIDARQLNFLFELLEKARTSTYDLHAKILARLYGNLILNGNLNYHESTFLANISILNDEDLLKFYNLLDVFFKEKRIDIDTMLEKQEKLTFETKTYIDLYIYDKLMRTGLIIHRNVTPGMNFFQPSGDIDDIFGNKNYYIHNFSKELYLLMKEVVGADNR